MPCTSSIPTTFCPELCLLTPPRGNARSKGVESPSYHVIDAVKCIQPASVSLSFLPFTSSPLVCYYKHFFVVCLVPLNLALWMVGYIRYVQVRALKSRPNFDFGLRCQASCGKGWFPPPL
ncbi:unnamed protein product [Choristocarpus tenellus]